MSEQEPPRHEVVKWNPSSDASPGKAVRLALWQRLTAGGVGLLMASAGVWAIIIARKDGAGSVALIIVALVLWLLALIGHLPYRLWGKDMGVEWEPKPR